MYCQRDILNQIKKRLVKTMPKQVCAIMLEMPNMTAVNHVVSKNSQNRELKLTSSHTLTLLTSILFKHLFYINL